MNAKQKLLCLAVIASLASPTAVAPAQSRMTPQEAKTIAKEAYIFSYPLVMMYRTMYLQAIDSKSKSYCGGFGNVKKVSVYFAVSKDDRGELFDGSKHNYSITFTADEIPPANNFWSWTMYKLPQRWLVDNPINRYSIGSATPELKKAADGSVTVYFQAKSPGKDKESNWLPSPEGPFWPILRTYGPGKTILDGRWKLPPVKREMNTRKRSPSKIGAGRQTSLKPPAEGFLCPGGLQWGRV